MRVKAAQPGLDTGRCTLLPHDQRAVGGRGCAAGGGGERVGHAGTLWAVLTNGVSGLQCEQPICTPLPKKATAAGSGGAVGVGGHPQQCAPHSARPRPYTAPPAHHHPSRAPRVAAAACAPPRTPRALRRPSARWGPGRRGHRTAATNGCTSGELPPLPPSRGPLCLARAAASVATVVRAV